MIAFGYVRVSGKGQVAGDGPERQKDAINSFCLRAGLGEPMFFCDLGVTGTVDAMDRDEFVKMIDAIERFKHHAPGGEACIVVEKLDRLARTLMVSEVLLARCAQRKIPVYASDQGALTDLADVNDEPMRKAIRQIIGVIAELDKTVTVRRLKVSRDRKRILKGRCEGILPYGYCMHEREVQKFLKAQKDAGKSYAEAAEAANAAKFKTRNRKPWTRGAVYQAIHRRGVNPPTKFDLFREIAANQFKQHCEQRPDPQATVG